MKANKPAHNSQWICHARISAAFSHSGWSKVPVTHAFSMSGSRVCRLINDQIKTCKSDPQDSCWWLARTAHQRWWRADQYTRAAYIQTTLVLVETITTHPTETTWLGAWRSGKGVGRINEVTLRRSRLVLGWVTCPGSTPGGGTLFWYVTS